MKKTIYITISTLIYIGLVNPTFAAETSFLSSIFKSHFKKDFSASVGLKTWVNEWEYPLLLTLNKNNMVRSQHSDTVEFAFIPILNFRYKNFLVSGSYLPKTDYSFEIQDVNYESISEQLSVLYTTKLDATREEWDINFGYYILPSLIVTAGYKNINRDFKLDYRNININNEFNFSYKNNNYIGNTETKGFTLGIAGVAPLRGQFGLYGSFAYGWLDTEKNIGVSDILGPDGTFDVEYYLGEVGLMYGYKLENIQALEAASIYIGYRFQALNEERGSLNNNGRPLEVTDTTSGFMFGVNLTF